MSRIETRTAVVAVAVLLTLFARNGNLAAAPQHCGNVTAEANGKGPGAGTLLSPQDAKMHYDAAFTSATRVALVAWAKKVSEQCPADSSNWSRATSTSVFECDRAMGGRFTVCATGMPAAK